MEFLPAPPPWHALQAVEPVLAMLEAGTTLYRIYFGLPVRAPPSTWRTFRAYGPTGSRFDHQEGLPEEAARRGDRRILYASMHGPTCFTECFQQDRAIDRRRNEPWFVTFKVVQPVVLLDLTGRWPLAAGANASIASGPRLVAQQWSRAIHRAYPSVGGLLYRASTTQEYAIALYERAEGAMPDQPDSNVPLEDQSLAAAIDNLAADYHYDITR